MATLEDSEASEALRFYVGLSENGARIVRSALAVSVAYPALHGRCAPWPVPYYRTAALAGACSGLHPSLIETMADSLLLEFDTETWFPQHAIRALANLGDSCVPFLADYLFDPGLDTFSREDAAMALGLIGTATVVSAIEVRLVDARNEDLKFAAFALGRTGNKCAVPVLLRIGLQIGKANAVVVTEALAVLGWKEPFPIGDRPGGVPFRPRLSKRSVLAELCPDLSDPVFSLAYKKMYAQYGPVAAVTLRQAGWPKDLQVIGSAIETLRKANRVWEEEILIAEAMDRYPGIDHIYHDFALALSKQKRFGAARRYYSIAMALRPDYDDFYNDFGVTMMHFHNFDAARFLFVRAISLNPKVHRPWYNLANIALGASSRNKSVPNKKVDVEGGGFVRYVGCVDFETANLYDAYILLSHVLQLNPTHGPARIGLDQICAMIGKPMNYDPKPSELLAATHLGELELGESVEAVWPSRVVELFQQSRDLRYAGNLEAARDLMKQALTLEPHSVEILQTLGMLNEQISRYDDALNNYESALRLKPNDRTTLMHYSNALVRIGRNREGVRAAQGAIATDPQKAVTWITLAKAYFAAENKRDAADALAEAMWLCAPYSWPLLHIEDMLEKLGLADSAPAH